MLLGKVGGEQVGWLIFAVGLALGGFIGALSVVWLVSDVMKEMLPIIKALQEDLECIADEIDRG